MAQRIIPKTAAAIWELPRQEPQLSFSTDAQGNAVKIGEGGYGTVYAGTYQSAAGLMHPVAVKRPHDFQSMNADTADRYQKMVDDLRAHDLPLVPTRVVKLPAGTKIGAEKLEGDEYAVASHLVGKPEAGGSNLESGTWYKTKRGRAKGVELLTKVANAGYLPDRDAIESVKGSNDLVLRDLDNLLDDEITPAFQAERLRNIINDTAKEEGLKDTEKAALYAKAFQTANPELKSQLRGDMKRHGLR